MADPGQLSEHHQAVLLVVIGHRRKGGVSKTRIGEILGLDAAPYLDELVRLELVYADPARELAVWRPRPEALLALGFRSGADIPALRKLEEWFDGQRDHEAALTKARPGRWRNRQRKRRASVGNAPEQSSTDVGRETLAAREESETDFLGGERPLPHPG